MSINWPELDLPPINLWNIWKLNKGKNVSIGETTDCVAISKKDYEQLLDDQMFLNCLRVCGVDNWEWYDEAVDMYHTQKGVDE
jgi:hypothetical protein